MGWVVNPEISRGVYEEEPTRESAVSKVAAVSRHEPGVEREVFPVGGARPE